MVGFLMQIYDENLNKKHHNNFSLFKNGVFESSYIFAVPGIETVGLSDFKCRVFLAANFCKPSVEVVAECSGTYLPEAVLFGKVFYFNGNVGQNNYEL